MKIPNSEWLAYQDLKFEDILQEYFQNEKFMAQALVEDRKGRIHVVLEQKDYQEFLEKVRKKYGNINAKSVNKAARDAIKNWEIE